MTIKPGPGPTPCAWLAVTALALVLPVAAYAQDAAPAATPPADTTTTTTTPTPAPDASAPAAATTTTTTTPDASAAAPAADAAPAAPAAPAADAATTTTTTTTDASASAPAADATTTTTTTTTETAVAAPAAAPAEGGDAAPSGPPASPRLFVDAFYVHPITYEIGPGNFEGKPKGVGGGVEIHPLPATGLFITGQYQRNTYDRFEGTRESYNPANGMVTSTLSPNNQVNGNIDLTSIRGGLGYGFDKTPLYVRAEYMRRRLQQSYPTMPGFNGDLTENGYGVFTGFNMALTERLSARAEGGYVSAGNSGFGRGLEYVVGADYFFIPRFGFTVDYRRTELVPNGGTQTNIRRKVGDLRIGFRLGLF